MSTIANVIAIVIGTLAIAAIIVGVIFYARSEVTKKTITSLKDLAEALEKRVDALEEEREMMRSRIDTLERENSVLRGMVNGEAKAIEMISISQKNHTQVMEVLASIREELK